MANVAWQRPELRNMLETYITIRDVLEGAPAIKGRRKAVSGNTSGANGWENIGGMRRLNDARRYLPQPNPDDKSPENNLRYRTYLERALWYGATARTLDGMTGQVFQRDPAITVPADMDELLLNIDGSGVTIQQLMTRAVDYGIAYGRAGLLADFPVTDGALTADDIAEGDNNPTITLYAPWQIINWRIEMIGSRKVITLLVLIDDNVFDTTDPFEAVPIMQYRVLKLNPDSTHAVEIWRETRSAGNFSVGNKSQKFTKVDEFTPLDASGKPLDEIPFTFIGAKNNDSIPDKPPMQDLADVNIAHYRNSADYEDSTHMIGQPTPYAAGLTETWVKNIWQSKTIPLGSRAVIPLPTGGTMGLLQAAENSMVRQAMIDKEHQMVMLGAKLIEENGTQQTATGELIDETSETSVLANVATNVAAAFKFALQKAALFMGITVTADAIAVKLNTSFQFTRMSAGDRQEMVSEWQKGAISWTELRTGLRATGVATQTDAIAKAEIAQELADAIATGVIADPLQAAGGVIKPPPPGQAPNPVPPASKTPAAKAPPSGKGK